MRKFISFILLLASFTCTSQVVIPSSIGFNYTPVTASSYMTATGGTITTDGNYKVHTFTSDGTFTVTTLPNPAQTIEILVVGGGGAGGGQYGGGGGGGGGIIHNATYSVTVTGYTVTIGAGGTPGNNGSNTVFNDQTSIGGGRGGYNGHFNGYDGGSGGGAGGSDATSGTGGAATSGQGHVGGNNALEFWYAGAGGGGGNAAGANATYVGSGGGGHGNGGDGGAGLSFSISGTSVVYGSGGGGGAWNVNGGTPGTGGTGAGTGADGAASDATGYGCGGGGSIQSTAGSGFQGIVVVRYQFQFFFFIFIPMSAFRRKSKVIPFKEYIQASSMKLLIILILLVCSTTSIAQAIKKDTVFISREMDTVTKRYIFHFIEITTKGNKITSREFTSKKMFKWTDTRKKRIAIMYRPSKNHVDNILWSDSTKFKFTGYVPHGSIYETE